jgi:hypothetical protein
MSFTKALVRIKKIEASELKNVEWMGKNDPFVILNFGNLWKDKTPHQEDAGAGATWETDLKMEFQATPNDIKTIPITCEVYDHNTLRSHTIIGTGSISINDLTSIGQSKLYSIDLIDNKKKSGVLKVTIELVAIPVAAAEASPPSSEIPNKNINNPPSNTSYSNKANDVNGNKTSNSTIDVSQEAIPPNNNPSTTNTNTNKSDIATTSGKQTSNDDIPASKKEEKNIPPSQIPNTNNTTTTTTAEKANNEPSSKSDVTAKTEVSANKKQLQSSGDNESTPSTIKKSTGQETKAQPPDSISKVSTTDTTSVIIRIKKIEASELKNVEIMGKNDPFVNLQFGELWKYTTPHQEDAGAAATWEADSTTQPKMEFQVTINDVKSIPIACEVYDHNSIRSHALIGIGSVSISSLVSPLKYGQSTVLAMDLQDTKGKKTGVLKLILEVIELPTKAQQQINDSKDVVKDKTKDATKDKIDDKKVEVAPTSAISNAEEKGNAKSEITNAPEIKKLNPHSLIRVVKIEASELKNVEMMGKNDPFVNLQFGDLWKYTTPHQEDVGAAATWETTPAIRPAMEFQVSPDDIQSIEMCAEVYDHNTMLAHGFIGSGSVHINELASNVQYGKTKVFSMDLFDNKKKKSGVLKLTLELVEIQSKAETSKNSNDATAKDEFKFERARVRLKEINATELMDVEFMGKNDPYVVFEYGKLWNAKTTVLADTGAVGNWVFEENPESNMQFYVTPSDLRALRLKTTVFDENKMKEDVEIGTGACRLSEIMNIGYKKDFIVSFDITNTKKNNQKSGHVSLTFELLEAKADEVLGNTSSKGAEKKVEIIPFIEGMLIISRIKCLDLPNVELMPGDKNDAYVVLTLNSTTEKTEVLNNIGTEPLWDNLDYVFDVTKDIVDNEKLTVQVYDHNSITSHTLIGSVELDLFTLYPTFGHDFDVQLVGNLINAKNKGKVLITARLKQEYLKTSIDQNIPESFTNGDLLIKRIRVDKLKNVELIGKSDPYVKLIFEKREYISKTLSNNGATNCWDSLDYKYENVSRERIQDGVISIELWDKNTILKDKFIGRGIVNTKPTGFNINHLTELRVKLVDEKNVNAGRLTLDVVLQESIDISKLQVDKNFKGGKATISKICCFSMLNTELLGSQVSYYYYIDMLMHLEINNKKFAM